MQKLAVLPADINDGAGIRVLVMHAACMAGDLGNGCVGQCYGIATISRGDGASNVGSRGSGLLENMVQKFCSKVFLVYALIDNTMPYGGVCCIVY